MEKFFHVRERGSTVRTEVMAGITTFMTMAYILMVNSGMFGDLGEGYYNAVYIATAISAVIGTVLIGLLANLPLAQASGMGLNAFFVYTVCFGMGFTYANALVFVLIDGVLFMLLTLTGLRRRIFEAIPRTIRMAIPAGIGLFIAFLGFQNAGIVTANESTCVSLVSLNILAGKTWQDIMPVLVTVIGLLLIAVLAKREVKGAVLWGILGSTVLYYVFGLFIPGYFDGLIAGFRFQPFAAFGDFAHLSFGKVFTEGFDFSAYLSSHSGAELVITFLSTSLAFCMVDMFDTMGTLYGACARGDMLDEDGNVPNMEQAMLSDAIATTTGAICGTSTVTTFVESSAGVAEGGRTGLAAMVTAGLFFISMFFTSIASLIPSAATAAALIYVGILMMTCVKDIEWTDPAVGVPAFLAIAMMPFTYNISYGIAFGVLSYIVIHVFTGRAKKVNAGTWVVGALFVAMFLLTH
ncbi:MAG TPA: guanine permease [Clostridiales bacterium]|nr:guanine permease [Clostridiales bacterium]